jgi:ribosomal protein S13
MLGASVTDGASQVNESISHRVVDPEQFHFKLQQLSEIHLTELETLRKSLEKKILVERQLAMSANMEISILQTELQNEREKHLSTVQDLSKMHSARAFTDK